MLSVCQSDGPSYLGIGALADGPSSYMESRATRWELKGLKVVGGDGKTPEGGCSTSEAIAEDDGETMGRRMQTMILEK